MHRPTVGVLALLLLAAGLVALLAPGDANTRQDIAGPCLRVGAVLAALWLALPELSRMLSRWALFAGVIALVIVAHNPKVIVVVLIALVGFAMLRPRVQAFTQRRR